MGLIGSILENPLEMLMFLLLALPGRFLAISIHEAAHGWVAEKCGDPTARMMGRVTLNPIRHIDLVGTLMILLVGIGWAKPVPVNPRNFRNYRRDDLKVSLAGITANLLLFLVCALALYGLAGAALAQVPVVESETSAFLMHPDRFLMEHEGEMAYDGLEGDTYYYIPMGMLLSNAAYLSEEIVAPVFGSIAGYLYQMIGYCMVTNIMLAIFNLIPLPPLDGYHVLNDLVLKKPLYASAKASAFASLALYALFFTGILDKALSAASGFVFDVVGSAAGALYALVGIL
ncbi:MAG: site-2 protease family protein [Eubacteriales bacterium]|nr:site-2 protease family protein [Eubacteriales bacterium]